MKTNNNSLKQALLPVGIPWYRTRLFWVVVIVLQLTIALAIINPLVPKLHTALSIVTGGWFFMWLSTIPYSHEYTTLLVQVAFVIYIYTMTLKESEVRLLYPTIYLALAIMSTFISYSFLTAFY